MLTIWNDEAHPDLVRIDFGKALLLHSDAMHASCHPKKDVQKNMKYYRLHFYLQTKFQEVPNDTIHVYDLDGRTQLEDIVHMAKFQGFWRFPTESVIFQQIHAV